MRIAIPYRVGDTQIGRGARQRHRFEGRNVRSLLAVCAAIFMGFAFCPGTVAQQDGGELLSPPAKTNCKFADGKTITVDYSSPRMRGRKIYNGLVPFGEVWRIGANDATTFVTDADLTVGGRAVPAGSYTLFAVPLPTRWKLIVSKKTGEWGIPYPGEAFDFLRVDMAVSELPAALENLTIGLDGEGQACTMWVDLENTRASVQVYENR